GPPRRLRVGGIDTQVDDAGMLRFVGWFLAEPGATDGDLADQLPAVGQGGAKANIIESRGVNVAGDGENFGGGENGIVEAAGNVGQRGEQEVAEGVAGQCRVAALEPVVE